MKRFRGGYDIHLAGKPAGVVEMLPEPRALFLPLWSRRFRFSDILVRGGEQVRPGTVLAKDPENFGIPLLAPRAGRVDLESLTDHIVLRDVAREREEPYEPGEDIEHVPPSSGSAGMRRHKLVMLGAWGFFRDAHTGRLPDPFGVPRAVIVSVVHSASFEARGDVQIYKRLHHFTRGLEHLQSLLEYQEIHLVLPDVAGEFARTVRERLRGYARVRLVQMPLRYPAGHPALAARSLGLRPAPEGSVWALDTAAVLAVDRALTLSRPSTVRIVSLGGPAVRRPVHLKAMPGYPLDSLLRGRIVGERLRTVNGGVLEGEALPAHQRGIDVECRGLTVLGEPWEREFLGFLRPGLSRASFSRCFLSALRPRFAEPMTTAIRGERRPCIGCGFCERVCPARIQPHAIHKHRYADALEDLERDRPDLCIACGLCSFVCPSKIELREEALRATAEVHMEEAKA